MEACFVINDLIKKLSLISEVEEIILFGSRARKDNDERSDIDIAIKTNMSNTQWNKQIINIGANMSTPSLLMPNLLTVF